MAAKLVLKLVASVLLVVSLGCGTKRISIPLDVGHEVPVLELKNVSGGKTFSVGSLKGDIVVLNFWSTTCGVCMQEIDDLKQIHDSGSAKVIGVALDEDPERVRRVIEKRVVKYPVLLGDQATFERFDGYSIPYTLVLDRSQVVLKKFFGRMSEHDLEEVIKAIPSNAISVSNK